jgi:hypothetical protein
MSRTHEPPSRRHMEGPQPPPRPDPKGGPIRPGPVFPRGRPSVLFGRTRPTVRKTTFGRRTASHAKSPQAPEQAPCGRAPASPTARPQGGTLTAQTCLAPGPAFCPRGTTPANCTEHGLRAQDCFAWQEPTNPEAGATWKGPSLPHGQTPRGDPYGPDLSCPGAGLLSSLDEPGRPYEKRVCGRGPPCMSRTHGCQSRRHVEGPQTPPRPGPKRGPLRPRPPFSPGAGLPSSWDGHGRLCGTRPSGGRIFPMRRTHGSPSRRDMEGSQTPPRSGPKRGPLRCRPPFFPRGRSSFLAG